MSVLKTRYQGIDLLRCCAIFCVVLNHCTEAVYALNLDGVMRLSWISKIFAFSAFTVGRIGVPCFLAISGYLLMDRVYSTDQCKKFWKDSWFHLVACTWLWFTIYDLLLVLQGKSVPWDDYLRHILFLGTVNFSHVWYMPVIIGIYLLVPVLSNGLHTMNNKHILAILGVYFIYSFAAPTLNIVSAVIGVGNVSVKFSSGFSGGAYGLYLLLGAMVKKGVFKRVKTLVLLLLVAFSYCTTVFFQLWSYHGGYKYNVWYDFPLLLVIGICLLELFSRIQTIPGRRIITVLSKYSFAVYLIHNTILTPLRPWLSRLNLMLPIKVIGMLVLISISSYIISFLIGKIPKVGPYLLYLKPTTSTHRK